MRRLNPANNFVPAKMGTGLRLLVGEAPGEADASLGEPFKGGSGTWLDIMLMRAKVRRDELTVINTIQCRPKDNLFPTDPKARGYISKEEGYAAVQQCVRNHVQPMLKARPWQRIDLLGEKALQFIGEKKPISTWRGSPIAIPVLGEKKIGMATWHPRDVMKNQVELPVAINDLRKSLVMPPEKYKLYPSLDDLQQFHAEELVFDIETPEYWRLGDAAPITIVGIADLRKHNEVLVVPFRGAYKDELKRIVLEAKELIGQNLIAFDIPKLFKALDIEWRA